MHFIDTFTDINRLNFQGDRSLDAAMTSIQPFYEMRSLDVTWLPDLEWPGSETFTTCVEKMYEQVYQKRLSFFLAICEQPEGGVQTPPARRLLTKVYKLML